MYFSSNFSLLLNNAPWWLFCFDFHYCFSTHNSECKVCRQEDILFSCNRAASCCNRKTRDGFSQGDILERLQETWLFVWQGNYIPFLISFLHCFQYLIIYCWKFSNCHGLYVVRLVVWSPYLIEIAIVLDINIASKIQLWKLLLRNILIQAAPSHILKVVSFNDKSTDPPSPPPKKKTDLDSLCVHMCSETHILDKTCCEKEASKCIDMLACIVFLMTTDCNKLFYLDGCDMATRDQCFL